MKRILVLGAGRSSGALIDYLGRQGPARQWNITVAEAKPGLAEEKAAGFEQIETRALDVNDGEAAAAVIAAADLVVSLLPAPMHTAVAERCLALGKHFLSASYVGDDMMALDDEARAKGLLFLNECGLDPGIDHLSGMRVIDQIRSAGGELLAFETFTGGLLAPNPDTNPWDYKFTWNPRNVVLAGQGGVKFLQHGRFKYIPYHRVFRRTEVIHIPSYGYFEGYANRDSLKYLDVYGLQGIRTLYRGTLRRVGFCRAWNVFVLLGATDDSYEMEGVAEMSHKQFINSFLHYNPHDSVELKLAHYMNLPMESPEMFKLRWLGLFDDELVGLERGTPAQILEQILKKRWHLDPDDRDMIVMWHKFDFIEGGDHKQIQSHMVSVGDGASRTAMAKTVGLPLGIAAGLVLDGKLTVTGVRRPVVSEIYEPILDELKRYGIDFVEHETEPQHGFVHP